MKHRWKVVPPLAVALVALGWTTAGCSPKHADSPNVSASTKPAAQKSAELACSSTPKGNGIKPATPELEKLDIWAGHWRTAGETVGADGAPGDPLKAVDIYEWMAGGFAMLHCFNVEVGGGSFQGVEIIGFDASNEDYPMFSIDSAGTAGVNRASQPDPSSWLFQGSFVVDGATVQQRTDASFNADLSQVNAVFEQSTDGGSSWYPIVRVILTKVTG